VSHETWGLEIEDYSVMVLRASGSLGMIETGYTFPAESGSFDTGFSLRTRRHYIVARSDDSLEVRRTWDGAVEHFAVRAAHSPWYPTFAAESIDRVARGRAPIAGLEDLAAAMRVIDGAYRSAGAGGAPVALGDDGPHA
jgi:predicted dehydrogenase